VREKLSAVSGVSPLELEISTSIAGINKNRRTKATPEQKMGVPPAHIKTMHLASNP
jgi:hypothetical protein